MTKKSTMLLDIGIIIAMIGIMIGIMIIIFQGLDNSITGVSEESIFSLYFIALGLLLAFIGHIFGVAE